MKARETRATKRRPREKKAVARDTTRSEPRARESDEPAISKAAAERKTEVSTAPVSRGAAFGISAVEALSFLKEAKGEVSWSVKEMASTLNIGAKEAAQALAVLRIQGYVRPAAGGEWLTTPEGEAVAGAKSPRYARASVEQAIAALKGRMEDMNRDPAAELKVAKAVAFGDFLSARPQVQAADVGVQLVRRKARGGEPNDEIEAADSAVEQAARKKVLQKLRVRTALLNLRPYEDWMNHRSHRKIL